MSVNTQVMEKIVALCRRRGFIFGSSEIYGGIGGFWDYGPLGCELKRNIKEAWWKDMVHNPPPGPDGKPFQMVGVDCAIIMNPKVWEASGHVGGFSDPMVDCRECKGRFRADQIHVASIVPEESVGNLENAKAWREPADVAPTGDPFTCVAYEVGEEPTSSINEAVAAFARKHNVAAMKGFTAKDPDSENPPSAGHSWAYFPGTDARGNAMASFVEHLSFAKYNRGKRPCPACHAPDALTDARAFNLMFQTYVGALQEAANVAYLRPETAQGIFVNFANVMDSTRVKIPFGIAQVGKAFRNEINPRNYTFRSREFEQMEIEFFCHPDQSRMWYEYWRDLRIRWYQTLHIKSENLRPREQGAEELAHYSCGTTDIEYLFPFSDEPQELEGVAHRGDFDLKAHGRHAKGKEDAFAVLDEETKHRYVPHVIEPSAGVDRFTLAALCEAYTVDESRASPEFLKLHPRLAPIKAAVFPLVAKDGLPEVAEPIYRELSRQFPCQFDAKQSIGKRYARMDEAGTPYCFTVDGQSKEDGTVTVRSRDDASQVRIDKSRCLEFLREKLGL